MFKIRNTKPNKRSKETDAQPIHVYKSTAAFCWVKTCSKSALLNSFFFIPTQQLLVINPSHNVGNSFRSYNYAQSVQVERQNKRKDVGMEKGQPSYKSVQIPKQSAEKDRATKPPDGAEKIMCNSKTVEMEPCWLGMLGVVSKEDNGFCEATRSQQLVR